MSEIRRGFLRRIRARMRLSWLSSTAQHYAPYLGLAMVGLFLAGWITAWDGALRYTLLLFLVAFAALAVGALMVRISPWDASRAAERGLDAHDAFTTALEFDDPDDEVHAEIQRRADLLAESSDVSAAIPLSAQPTRLRQFGIAAALALLIGLLPPFTDTPALSSDLEAAIHAEAEEVERIAEAVEASDVENADEIVAELEKLAEELRESLTLDEALQALEKADARLDAGLDPKFLAQKAAVQGLATDLTLRPLVSGAPLDAASQLNELADSLAGLSEPERQAISDRLGDLAESQAAGNPSLSGQLSDAAAALGAGDLAGAQQALQNAASSQQSGLASARGQQAITETQRALAGVAARLGAEGQGQGQGQGEGSGQGPGQGEGQGQGQGSGAGQGGGGGQGGGAGSGAISGVAPGQGSATGQGGSGTVGAGSKGEFGTGVETSSVFSPIDRGEVSDLIQVGIDGGSGEGAIVGRGDAPTQRGDSIIPYAQVLPEYLNDAADALAALRLPPSMRSIVQSYFDQLAFEAS